MEEKKIKTKKFLYLDKFEVYVEKKEKEFKKLEHLVKFLHIITIVQGIIVIIVWYKK